MVLELPGDIKDQVGTGHLFLELVQDLREEDLWKEEIMLFTRHTNKRNWTEAEAECQREKGHLVSVSSEVENEIVYKVAGRDAWLGARNVSGRWRWSDNSSWVYNNWDKPGRQPVNGYGNCVRNQLGMTWKNDRCRIKLNFACEVGHTLSLIHI